MSNTAPAKNWQFLKSSHIRPQPDLRPDLHTLNSNQQYILGHKSILQQHDLQNTSQVAIIKQFNNHFQYNMIHRHVDELTMRFNVFLKSQVHIS